LKTVILFGSFVVSRMRHEEFNSYAREQQKNSQGQHGHLEGRQRNSSTDLVSYSQHQLALIESVRCKCVTIFFSGFTASTSITLEPLSRSAFFCFFIVSTISAEIFFAVCKIWFLGRRFPMTFRLSEAKTSTAP